MKKVGIVTFYNHNNFGAMLQAYALKQIVESYGIDAKFISFGDNTNESNKTKSNNSPLLRKILNEEEKRSEHFNEFRQKYLPAVNYYDDITEDFDCFIAGSDQIWNKEIVGNDERYFLSFATDDKKIAYAPSFGLDSLQPNESDRISCLLKGFGRCLSVRELSGSQIINDGVGINAPVCLDPTLLTKPDTWVPFSSSANGEPYILLISVQNDPILLKQAQTIAKEKNMKLKIISASYFPMIGFEPWSGVTVPDWVNLIRNASFVISSSFHGIAFSIIFHKTFTFIPLKNELASRNGRVVNLLDTLGISDHSNAFFDSTDWSTVDKIRLELANESRKFLKESLTIRGII